MTIYDVQPYFSKLWQSSKVLPLSKIIYFKAFGWD